jgi:regulator of RNase E activity RraA
VFYSQKTNLIMKNMNYEKNTVSKETLENLQKISATTSWGTLGRVMGNRVLRDSYRMMNMRPIDNSYKICGPAVTVRYLPVDPVNPTKQDEVLINNHRNMMVKMMEALSPGKVLVLAALGRSDAGVAGEGMNHGFKAHGASGVVVDGGERDVPVLRNDVDLPIFMSGHATLTTAGWHIHEGKPGGVLPQEINVPVKCDGVMVRPGDVIIGDEDGVMVIPREYAKRVGEIGAALEEIEELQRRLIAKGEYTHGQPMDEDTLKKYGLLEKYLMTREAQV